MRIGEVAAAAGVTVKAVRFWEATGLLADPPRTSSGYRDYGSDAIERLTFIRNAQVAGLTLDEVKQVLAISDGGRPPCGHVAAIVGRHLDDVDRRIRELTQARRQLRELARRAAEQDPAGCDRYCVILRPAEPAI